MFHPVRLLLAALVAACLALITYPAAASGQHPTATYSTAMCGQVSVSYYTSSGDTLSSKFQTSVDGVIVNSKIVPAPAGRAGYNSMLAEDSSGGSASVVVTANGATLLSFEVVTDCQQDVQPSLKTIGMSAPAADWTARLADVGSQGITARRIYGDLTSTGDSQSNLIQQANSAGMLPVVSYKMPSITSATSGSYDSWVVATANYLASTGKPASVTFWHEPYGDMTGAQFVQMQERFVPIVQAHCPLCKVGPILNGWLLDNKTADFQSFISSTLLNEWDFVGIDTYQSGTQSAPGSTIPGDRIAPLEAVLSSDGHPDMPIAVGEYNGFTAQAIADSGEDFLSNPNLWFALMWNSDGGKGVHLSGDRLAAFKATKADSRVQQ